MSYVYLRGWSPHHVRRRPYVTHWLCLTPQVKGKSECVFLNLFAHLSSLLSIIVLPVFCFIYSNPCSSVLLQLWRPARLHTSKPTPTLIRTGMRVQRINHSGSYANRPLAAAIQLAVTAMCPLTQVSWQPRALLSPHIVKTAVWSKLDVCWSALL